MGRGGRRGLIYHALPALAIEGGRRRRGLIYHALLAPCP